MGADLKGHDNVREYKLDEVIPLVRSLERKSVCRIINKGGGRNGMKNTHLRPSCTTEPTTPVNVGEYPSASH